MAILVVRDTPISIADMDTLTDVVMAAIHKAYAHKDLDAYVLIGSLTCAALGVLRDIEEPSPKERLKALVDAINLEDIHPHNPSVH
ncbi:MAG: hypothetical protein Q7S87_00975 [Agitococcus sp.]|nr:hypothetical protein [Agitococcus sp.]MDO9179100.1 hypothetical protein [Agitococcus sp.]